MRRPKNRTLTSRFDLHRRSKNVSLTKARYVQVRVELFNALNHPNFGLPGHTLGAPNFGVVSDASGGRTIQLGLRAVF